MLPIRFATDLLHSDRVSEDGGRLDKLFVRLTFELLRKDYPNLSFHDRGGKDGAIDLWNDLDIERHIFECKQIGIERKQQPWEAAQSAWRQVKDKLNKNLPLGPSECHAPYKPWLANSPQITRYTFVVSCSLTPLNRKDELRREIKADFETLSTKTSLLKHLKDVEVDIVDWGDLRRRLETQPQVHFRWFKDFLPIGLSQLSDDREVKGFRRYQHESNLPYYSLREHLYKNPHVGIPDEESLWKSLADGPAGLVISGIGGVGKSRLMLELGKLAAKDGWIVCEALPIVKPETVDGFARRNSSTGVLYLFDYLENLPAFRDTSLHIAQLAGSGVRVRFIASARESFVKSEQMIDDSIIVLPHSPVDGGHSAWWNSYRATVFEHIANYLVVDVHRELPTDVPAVAVLEAELRKGTDSSSGTNAARDWVVRRLTALLHRDKVSKKSLAVIAAQCPFDDDAYVRLSDKERDAFNALYNAGWIEMRETSAGHNSYWIIHDYLADQLVLGWLANEGPRGLQKSAEIREILGLAYVLGTLGSAIATLQRIIDLVSGFGFGVFSNVLKSEISNNKEMWRLHRQDVLYTRLLLPTTKVALLYELKEYWQGAENESWFQLEVAVLAKVLATLGPATSDISIEARGYFESLVVSLASAADERNMLITYGLRLLPRNEQIQQTGLNWLARYADRFGATYVIRAWLDKQLPWKRVESGINAWLARFGKSVDAQFVLAAWLRAVGKEGLPRFRTETLAWCEQYGGELVAQHVYSAWLKSGGETDAILCGVQRWLARHGALEEEPSFLFRRWLRAGGKVSLILPHLNSWLVHHRDSNCAAFVYSAAADFSELRGIIHEPMLAWISKRSTEAIAHPCLVAWLRSSYDRSLVAKYLRDWLSANGASPEAGEVIGKWLEAKGKPEMVLPYAAPWVEAHSESAYVSPLLQRLLETEGISDEACNIALRWLKVGISSIDAERVLSAWLRSHHGVASIENFIVAWCQKFETEPSARYLYEQWLLNGGNPEVLIKNIMAWLAVHGNEIDAGRVLSALLRASVPWATYREHLKQWTGFHSRDRDATYFYHAWLVAPSRKPSLIENSIRAWLQAHGEWENADFVINAWLKREDAPTDTVRAGYEKWMAANSNTSQSKTVRRNWEAALERERRARQRKLK